jgi:hypothetical protein
MVRHLTNQRFSEVAIRFCGGERRLKYLEQFMACGAEQSHSTAIAKGFVRSCNSFTLSSRDFTSLIAN